MVQLVRTGRGVYAKISVLFPMDLWEKVQSYKEELRKKRPFITDSDVVRELVAKGLEDS